MINWQLVLWRRRSEIVWNFRKKLFEEALKLEPANMRNSMLFSNLGTVQHRLGKIDKAIESYTLGLNLAPYSVTILLNRAALYLEKKPL